MGDDRAQPQGAQAPTSARAAGVPDSTRAWLVAVAGLLANAACWGTMNSFGAFLDSMTDEFDASLGATALIYALPSFVLFTLGIFTGPLADRFGPRRMVLAGAALSGGGLLLTSVAPSLPVAIVAYGLGMGLGMACFLVPLTACIGGWFVRRRAIAQGLSAAGAGLGNFVVVPLSRWLIDGHGWRGAYQVLAVICTTALVLAALVAVRGPNAASAVPVSWQRLRTAAAAGPFRELYAAGFLISAAMFLPFVFLVRYATDHGIRKRDAALLISVLGASNIVCRLVATSLASRVGAVRMYLVCVGALPVGLVLWLAVGGSYLGLSAFAAVLGISHGGYVSLSPEVTAERFGVANLGTVLGALWTAPGIAGLLSPVLGGVAIDEVGYTPTIAAALVLAGLGVLAQRRLWAAPAPAVATTTT